MQAVIVSIQRRIEELKQRASNLSFVDHAADDYMKDLTANLAETYE